MSISTANELEFMLDAEVLGTLKEYFSKLQTKVTFALSGSGHHKYKELLSLLTQVSQCHKNLELIESANEAGAFPSTHGFGFKLLHENKPTGIRFAGVPGGHEFNSFILAILHVAGQGKGPDPILQRQIRKIKGPVRLRTFVSLSCENCPELVQTLNQMALIHADFENEMVDGDLAPEEVSRLKIGSVPAVYAGDVLVANGKLDFSLLIDKLTSFFGVDDSRVVEQDLVNEKQTEKHFDVLVVGGGPAGASAAIYSARKGLRTGLVAERMGGQVKDTKGIENLISTVYTEGEILVKNMLDHLNEYPVEILEHRRVEKFSLSDNETKFAMLNTGEKVTFDRLIFATGAKWRELKVPGEKEYLGRGVAFCPHCDGPLYKGKTVAVIGGGNSGVEAALDLSGICKEIILLEFSSELKADRVLVEKMKATQNIRYITNAQTEEVVGKDGTVVGLRYLDRSSNVSHVIDLSGVFVQIGLVPNSAPLKGLVEMNSFGEIVIDAKGRTSVPGVYAAGDVTTVPYKQIVVSLGEGAKAALAAFEDRMHG
jgi:NADH-dependent peroxiredoxin subunit F